MFESFMDYFKGKKAEEAPASTQTMTQEEKKEFLSNDFIHRMIRVEQRVAVTFGTTLSYKQTTYYQSLPSEEKKRFDRYMKGARPTVFLISLFSVGFALFLLSFRFPITGGVISETVNEFFFGASGLWLLLLGIDLLFLFMLLKYRKEKHFNKRFDMLEEIIKRRYYLHSHTSK
ncbi:MAG: hypothetical protein RL557_1010 [archaeon]|jgi:uncharacterized BrkB/YihY/UPF0761 family membrane protein